MKTNINKKIFRAILFSIKIKAIRYEAKINLKYGSDV